jgi:S1-C subfamily serine protease
MFRQQRPRYGMGVEDNAEGDGARVSTISPGSQAEKASMMVGDIITAVDDKPVKTVDGLRVLLAQVSNKTALNITVLRNGKTTTLSMAVPKVIKTAEL